MIYITKYHQMILYPDISDIYGQFGKGQGVSDLSTGTGAKVGLHATENGRNLVVRKCEASYKIRG